MSSERVDIALVGSAPSTSAERLFATDQCDVRVVDLDSCLDGSDAPWLLVLSANAVPATGSVQALIEAAKFERRAAAVAPRIELPDGTVAHSTHRFPSPWNAMYETFVDYLPRELAAELLIEGAWQHNRPRNVDWADGTALLLRREALADIGPIGGPLTDAAVVSSWCYRAKKAGWTIRFEPDASVRLDDAPSQSERSRIDAEVRSIYTFFLGTRGRRPTLRLWISYTFWTLLRSVIAAGLREPGRRLWRERARAHARSITTVQPWKRPSAAA